MQAGIGTPFVAGTVWRGSPIAALFAYAAGGATCAAAVLLATRETSGGVQLLAQAGCPAPVAAAPGSQLGTRHL